MLLQKAVWNSVVSVANKDRWFLCATRFSTQQSRSVSLCGLPLRGWAVVDPKSFHFTITALTVERASASRAEIWRTDLLKVASYDGATLKVTELFSKAILLTMSPVINKCGWNSRIYSFQRVSTYFVYIVYVPAVLTVFLRYHPSLSHASLSLSLCLSSLSLYVKVSH